MIVTQEKIVVLQANVDRDKAQLVEINRRLTQAENTESGLAGSAASSQVFSNYQTVIASFSDQRLGVQNDLSTSLQAINCRRTS